MTSGDAIGTLPGHHLLKHLLRMRDTVLERDARLFSPGERRCLRGINRLPRESALLLARLFTRKAGWIRQSTLNYPECPKPAACLDVLRQSEWIDIWPAGDEAPPPDLLESLTHGEIRHLLHLCGTPPGGRAALDRQRLLERLLHPTPHARQLDMWVPTHHEGDAAAALASVDAWLRVKPDKARLMRLVEICHFGGRDQGLAQFTLEGMGRQRFVSVRLSRRGFFRCREDLDLLLDEGHQLDLLLEGLDHLRHQLRGWRAGQHLPAAAQKASRDLLSTAGKLATPLRQERPMDDGDEGSRLVRRVRLKALCAGAALLERLGRRGAAAGWQRLALSCGLQGRRRGEQWQRLVHNLRHSGREESAGEALHQALGESLDPLAHRELERLAGVAAPLGTPPVIRITMPRHPGHRGGRVLVRDQAGAALTAEEAALRLLAREGWRCLHAENILLRALVGLCAWDLIFMPLPGAFLHAFQSQPLDWGRPGFLARREKAWHRLEGQLRRNRHHAALLQRLEDCAGLQNPLVSWPLLLPGSPVDGDENPLWREGLLLLVEKVPGAVLADFTARMLEHPGACGHGLPDLLLWRDGARQGERDWLMVEVKGPGDRLFAAQRLWHHWLLERDMPLALLRMDEATTVQS